MSRTGTGFCKYAVMALSLFVALVVLNRWIVTDIGVLSYGRVWHLYISYEDFGFVRRALVGTLLSVSGLNAVPENAYHFAILLHHVSIVLLFAILVFYIVKNDIDDLLLIATVMLSPALLIQSGYTTGSLDIFVLILAALNILYFRHLLPFCLVLVFGTFVHELFLFTVPAQLVSFLMMRRGQEVSAIHVAAPLAAILGATLIVFLFGTTDLPRETVEAIMAAKIPSAENRHTLWSGYFEISVSSRESAEYTVSTYMDFPWSHLMLLPIPLIYVCLVAARLAAYDNSASRRAVLIVAALFPLLVSFFATDLYRWIGMSASMGLLLTLQAEKQGGRGRSGLSYALLPFSCLGPLGAARIDWPFPVLQFLLDRLFQ